ncbi:hypothetical protein ACLOJK_031444 [Asimina triloba]
MGFPVVQEIGEAYEATQLRSSLHPPDQIIFPELPVKRTDALYTSRIMIQHWMAMKKTGG